MTKIVKTEDQLLKLVRVLDTVDVIAYDLETSGLDPRSDTVLIIAISDNRDEFAIDAREIGVEKSFGLLKPILESKLVIAHNAVFDMKFAIQYGVDIRKAYCTMVVEQMLTAGLVVDVRADLASVASRYLDIELSKDIRSDFIDNPGITLLDTHYHYAAKDTKYLFRIRDEQLKKVRHYGLEKVLKLEMALLPCTAYMEYAGIEADKEKLDAIIQDIEPMVHRAKVAIQDVVISMGAAPSLLLDEDEYVALNIRSRGPVINKQTGEKEPSRVLQALSNMGIDVDSTQAKVLARWDLTNQKRQDEIYAYDFPDDIEEALQQYEGMKHPFLKVMSYYTAIDKILSTAKTLSERIVDGRLQSWFKQYGAKATGRYSSNAQQITQDGKLRRVGINHSIRQCLKAKSGSKLIIADYTAIELIIAAVMAEDKKLLNEVLGGDPHIIVCHTALAKLFPDAANVTAENKSIYPYRTYRDVSKMTTYATMYGVTGSGLSDQINIALAELGAEVDRSSAQALIDFWKTESFPVTGRFLAENAKKAVTDGYTESALGRKRFYDLRYAMEEGNKFKLFAFMREGSNQPIQSTSADITKLGMFMVDKHLDRKRARIVLTVHDEILVEADSDYAEEAASIVSHYMEKSAMVILGIDRGIVSVDAHISECYDK